MFGTGNWGGFASTLRPATTAVLLVGCAIGWTNEHIYSSVHWSPQGNFVAYLAQAGDADAIIPPAWLFGAESDVRASLHSSPVRRQLWMTARDGLTHRLIDESEGWLGPPAWSPDGRSLIYLRFTPEGAADDLTVSGRLELIKRERGGEGKTLRAKSGRFPRGPVESIPFIACDWSPDGQTVAAGWIGNRSLAVIDVNSGSIVREWPLATLPSFSSSGDWLSFLESGSQPSYRLVRVSEWSLLDARIDAKSCQQPLVWESIGEAVLLVRPQSAPRPADGEFAIARRPKQSRFEVCRISIPDMGVEILETFQRPMPAGNPFLAAYWDFAPGKDEYAVSILGDGLFSQLEFVENQRGKKRWHPLDPFEVDSLLPVGAIRYAPDGKTLALRFGVADHSAPVALVDLGQRTVQTVAPSFAMQLRALWSIAQTAERLVRHVPPGTPVSFGLGNQEPERTYAALARRREHPLELFGVPSELDAWEIDRREAMDEIAARGIAIIDDPMRRQAPTSVRRRLTELAAFFHYARRDYDAALELAKEMSEEDQAESSTRQVACKLIEIQCLMGAKRADSARWHAMNLARQLSAAPRFIEPRKAPPETDKTRNDLLERLGQLYDQLFSPPTPSGSHSP